MRTINIQKALSYPHCTGFMQYGDSRCAVGAVINAMVDDDVISQKHALFGCETITPEASKILDELFPLIDVAAVARINDESTTTNTVRDQLRKYVITELLKKGYAEPLESDKELSRELLNVSVCNV